MQTALRKDRDVAVDFIKAFAILVVVLIHVSTGAYANPVGSFPWYSAVLWGSVSRASVPLFLMCTGVLFLGPERELSEKSCGCATFCASWLPCLSGPPCTKCTTWWTQTP